MMYEMFNEIPFTQTGPDSRLKLHEAVGMMMNCCQFQEYQEAEFCKYLRSSNIAIFLFSMQLDILRFPAFREKVRTAVKIYGLKSIYGLRRITMHDEAGKLCFISNATGAFFDMNVGKAVKLDVDRVPLRLDEAEPMECLPRKIPVPQEPGEPMPSSQVRPSGLDPNGHLTSAMYFAMAQDALPENYAYNRIRVEFKKQAKCGEVITPVRFRTAADSVVIDMRDSGGASCAAAEFTIAQIQKEIEK